MDATIERELSLLVEAIKSALGDSVVSIALFGSAAEDRLRPSSDINLAIVLSRFDPSAAAALREPLRLAAAAFRLRTMVVLEDELPAAVESFAVKLADIRRRHRVLHGSDPFAALVVPRAAAVRRLRQVLLNLSLRLREQWLTRGTHDELLVRTVAEVAGPLRSCAAELLDLEGRAVPSPREALEVVSGRSLPALSEARERGALPAGAAAGAVLELIELASAMRVRAGKLEVAGEGGA